MYNRHLVLLRKFSKFHKPNLYELLTTMPKEPKHIAEAQKQRKKIKEKFQKYSPGKVTLQVLGSGAKGAPRCLYVFSDQSRYLFNCGEGTQRLAHEHKMKLAKLEHIFVTQSTWCNIGGLPGTALTIQDVGVPQITLHGPKGLEELFVATHRFVVIKDLNIQMANCDETQQFEDSVMKVDYVPLISCRKHCDKSQKNSPESLEDNTDYYAYESSGKRKPPQKEISETSKILLEEIKETGVAMAYICRLQPRPGALCLDKCVKFGVPPGPLLGKLKSGEDVTLADGRVVKTRDVCEPDDPGPVFIVIECPSEDYLDSLLANTKFQRHQNTATNDEDLAYIVVHFTDTAIVNHPKYREWIDRFSPSTQHLFLNDSNECMGSLSVHRIQYQLNQLSVGLFPILGDQGTESIHDTLPNNKRIKSDSVDCNNRVVAATKSMIQEYQRIQPKTLFNYHLRPRKGADDSMQLKLYPHEFIDEIMSIEDFPTILNSVKSEFSKITPENSTKFPRILFLGTGSSIPNKTRNTSAILVEINDDCAMLLDCGEGTYGQLVRFYGQNRCDEIIKKIKAVYISHLHADHHLGLIGLLQNRRDYEPIVLFAPKQIQWWLNFYDRCFENISQYYRLIPNQDLCPKLVSIHSVVNRCWLLMDFSKQLAIVFVRLLLVAMEFTHLNGKHFTVKLLENHTRLDVFDRLGLSDLSTCFVKHCPNAFGLSLIDRNQYKLVYSGDTMPCENLINLGRNCDLLIHEATMEDELQQEAIIKMHSTTSQAIESGKLMNARFILLTHFSQRYAKLPKINENFSENIGIAFDNMQVTLDDLPKLHILYPALKAMFVEHYEEMEQKTAKRLLKLERQKEALLNQQK